MAQNSSPAIDFSFWPVISPIGTAATIPAGPRQLIGAAWSLLLFGLLWFTRKKDWAAGTRYWLVVAVYSLGALLIGFTRGADVPRFYGWRVDQLLDALLVVAGTIGLWRVQRLRESPSAEQAHG